MRVLVFPALLFLLATASAITLEVTFGAGIQHNASTIEGFGGVPDTGNPYYFTASGVSQTAGDAFVVSQATVTGNIVYSQVETVGDCTWEALVAGNVVALGNFNGYAISDAEEIKWRVTPNEVSVTTCKLVMDYNIS